MSWIPERPEVPEGHRMTGPVPLRFEDVSQEGHMVLEALPHAVDGLWRKLSEDPLSRGLVEQGTVPILGRIVIETGDGPVSATAGPLEGTGTFQLSHAVGSDGQVDRIFLDMWAEVVGVQRHTYGPKPDAGAPRIVAGRVFAEHVFTRPFGPASDRRVRALRRDGAPWVPEVRRESAKPESLLELPEGAVALDAETALDDAETVFGRDHTDSNQHVNSLVYTRVFVEAALRRLDGHGKARPPLLGRALEIAYRKPSFAGERVRVALRTFTLGGRLGAVAMLLGAEEARGDLEKARPRTFARILFEP